MTFKYPNTLKAMERAEYDQWDIAEALLKDIPVGEDGVNNGAKEKLIEAQKEAADNGHDWSVETLQQYRKISQQFKAGSRIPAVSMQVHLTCGTPAKT
jgi:hypothetical protein